MKPTLFVVAASDLTCTVLDRGQSLSFISGQFIFDCSGATLRQTTQESLSAAGVELMEGLEVSFSQFVEDAEQADGKWAYEGVVANHPIGFLRNLSAFRPDTFRDLLNANVTVAHKRSETSIGLHTRAASPKPMLATLPARTPSRVTGAPAHLAVAA